MKVTIGVDPAGGSHDRCAIVVVEHVIFPKPRIKGFIDKIVRRVVRLPELAEYEQQADEVVAVAAKLPPDAVLMVEAGGGYGTGVIGYLKEAKAAGRLRQTPRPMNLSAALPGPVPIKPPTVISGEGFNEWAVASMQTSIPKVELYTAFAREARAGRVHIPPGLENAEQLRIELLGMKQQATPTGRLTFNNEHKESEFDDLFCAAALAVRFTEGGRPRYLNLDGTESLLPFCRTCGTPMSDRLHVDPGHGDHFARL